MPRFDSETLTGAASARREVARAATQVAALARSAVSRLQARHPVALAFAGTWLVAVLLDAVSTLTMNGRGFEEANPLVAPLMTQAGSASTVLTVVVASMLALTLGLLSCGRPRGTYATVAFAMVVLVLVAKVLVGTSNWVLLFSGTDLF